MSLDSAPRPVAARPTGLLAYAKDRLKDTAQALVTPLVPGDYLDLVAPLRNSTHLRGRIEAVRPETADAATLVIRPGRGWTGHTPGQYLRVGVEINGVRQWRTYSLTGPMVDGCVTVTVKAIPDGLVSNHLVRALRPGTVLHLDQAAGDFVLPDVLPTKALFVTAGSGITPVMGMLRHRVLADAVLVHSAPTAADVIFAAELRALAADGRIRLVERHTDVDGLLSTADLEALVPDLAEREVWACGPTGMLDAIEEHLAGLGRLEHLHVERFRPVLLVTGEGGTLSFEKSGATVEADGATPILQAAEDAGVLMPSGCRMGICFGCVLPLRQGAVRDLRDGRVTTAVEGEDVLIQTCVSAAAGSCRISH